MDIWCQNDVDATWHRRISVNTTSFLGHVPPGKDIPSTGLMVQLV